MLKRATVLKGREASSSAPLQPMLNPPRRATIVRRAVAEATELAGSIVQQARAEALAIRAEAQQAAQSAKQAAFHAGHAEGLALAASRAAVIGQLEASSDERGLARTLGLARILAERLLGENIRLDEAVVVALAQKALAEVKGIRAVQLLVNAEDLVALQAGLPLSRPGFVIALDPSLGRGDFRIVTELGTIDAKLGDRLDLLAAKLSDSLKKGT
jgi:flagellar biosynthesis/type III secretory pathway protein FliH